jgi:hypothetical protein
MAKLIYAMPRSLDGYIEDETGKFDWATPDEEGFAFINDLERPIGTYFYGRKLYQTMAIGETPDVIPPDVIPGGTPAMLDFARTWQGADKIVYSKSLETVRFVRKHAAMVFTVISAITFVVTLIPDFTYIPTVDGVSKAEIGVLVVMHAIAAAVITRGLTSVRR